MAKDDAVRLRALHKRQDSELVELERRVEELRVAYEHYFMGLEKREPMLLRAEVVREVRRSELDGASRTPVRFRFATLRQRLATYESYWDRMCRQIEEGTVKRERFGRFKAVAKAPASEPDTGAAAAASDTEDAAKKEPSELAREAEAFLESLTGTPSDPAPPPPRSGPPPLPPAAQRARATPPPLPGTRPYDQLYREYLDAKRANAESVERVSYDAFARSVSRQATAGEGELKVAVRNGKVTLVLRRTKK